MFLKMVSSLQVQVKKHSRLAYFRYADADYAASLLYMLTMQPHYCACCRFGDIMIDNMRARQCELPGILACNTLADQETRFTDAGFTTVRVCLFDFYKPISCCFGRKTL